MKIEKYHIGLFPVVMLNWFKLGCPTRMAVEIQSIAKSQRSKLKVVCSEEIL